MLNLDTFQRLAITKAARRGIVYHLDLPTLQIRHYKDAFGLSSIVIANDSETLATMPLDSWVEYCKQVTYEVSTSALASLNHPLVSAMSMQERALYISSHSAFYAEITGVSKRNAKRRAVKALQELDALQVYGKSLVSKEAPKPKQDKPRPQTTHVKSRASSASSRVLFRQKLDAQGKGRRIPAKRTESLAPDTKIRRKAS